jgi:hypothetical protein
LGETAFGNRNRFLGCDGCEHAFESMFSRAVTVLRLRKAGFLSADGQNQPLRVESKPANLRVNYWSRLSLCESATDERTQIEFTAVDFSIK